MRNRSPPTRCRRRRSYKRGSADLAALRKDGKPEAIVRARREVVLCAGAVATPWLLMLSGASARECLLRRLTRLPACQGVGPAEELAAKGIPVVADLPVGRNLQARALRVLRVPRRLTVCGRHVRRTTCW